MSDRGLPQSYRHVNGYGSHTYSLHNSKGERFWVKFHFKTMQGHRHYTDEEAAAVVGGDRESHQRDLVQAIERGRISQVEILHANHARRRRRQNALQPL